MFPVFNRSANMPNVERLTENTTENIGKGPTRAALFPFVIFDPAPSSSSSYSIRTWGWSNLHDTYMEQHRYVFLGSS